ncbi:MAG: alpha,alpha-phosphotrehalase [Acidobacteria bacterium]|nr:alpha,alpha-phosphotrehalase [Acidobacteriota bacterium]
MYSPAQTKPNSPEHASINNYQPRWWKEAVVYQVYPRSFKDSNGDGIGDLKGITSELDYIQGLGVNVIWLSPHYDSPNADNGYDIRDYRKVMTEFGTMADFDELLRAVKQRHMRLVLDLVVNHTSDEHRWFVESRKSKDSPYRNYYIWRPGKNGKEPNNWTSFFSGSAWKLDPATGEYYLHLFAEKQPDLNWDNPKVRHEVYDLMKFWLDKGVDGFRMDVIPFVSKDQKFPDFPANFDGHAEYIYAAGPHMHEYLQEMNREVLSKYDVMTVGEAFGTTLQQTPLLVDDRRHELNMIFNFDAVRIDQENGVSKNWTLPELKSIFTRQDTALDAHCWNTVFLSNHDNPRIVSSFGDDSPAHRVPSAKLVATMILTLKGTPFVYEGDELGMTNYPFKGIEDFDDIAVKNAWKDYVLGHKVSAGDFLANMRKTSRDNARTPMQWDAAPNAGFTAAAKPWLALNPNYTEINAKSALADRDSIYHYYRSMIDLRRKTPALLYGDYKDLDPANSHIFSYTRTAGKDGYLVVLNFSKEEIAYTVPGGITAGELQLSNLGKAEEQTGQLHLKAWEARVYKVASGSK